ncbi:MAG: septation protein A [Alphaproteobacteria bacterium]|nr:septation protein A [Alphaproteobacteria bacterium]
MTPRLNAAIEYGPLAVFLAAYFIGNRYLDDNGAIMLGTAAIMVATTVALSVAWFVQRRVPKVPLISGVLLMVFGGLTLWLQDPVFFKMKPTMVYLLFSVVLLGGLAMRKPLLKSLLGSAWQLTDMGWRKLTLRFGLFFVAMAALNELVWRTQTTDFWVSYKVFGTMGLILLFTMSQVGLINRHQIKTENDNPDQAPRK